MNNREESRTDLGLIRIHKNVIASISSLAALEIEGVKRISTNSLLEIFGKKTANSIKVELIKNEEVKVDIPVYIKYGFNIPDIANRIQENVRIALEKMTDLSIKDININVLGIERG